MSRPIFLVFLLVVMIITSQFEWRQPLVTDVNATRNVSQKQIRIYQREDAVKEKIILSQEKSIQKLHELVGSLREQLLECQSSNGSTSSGLNNLTESIIELERQQLLED